MSARTLVLGKHGQLASEIRALRETDPDFRFVSRDEFARIHEIIDIFRPEFVINTAAYTAVDKAETEADACFQANRDLPEFLAQLSSRYKFHLIHFSTDYVFDGLSLQPYRENDATNPINTYGESKLQGEVEVRKHAASATIVRTSWVYSKYGHNFVKTMLRLGQSGSNLKVVADQVGCPTWAGDLAKLTVDRLLVNTGKVDLVHYSSEGQTSWCGFAEKIFSLAKREVLVERIATKDFPTPARRPAYSVLAKDKIREVYGTNVPHWEVSLARCLDSWEN